MGGAVDLLHGARRLAVISDHVTKDGRLKLLKARSRPRTGVGGVTRVYTGLAVIDIVDGRVVLVEKLPSMTVEALQAVTGAELVIPAVVGDLIVPEL